MNDHESARSSKADEVLAEMQELHWRLKAIYEDSGAIDPSDQYGRFNTALIEQMTLVALLVEKGLIGEDEYFDRLLAAYGKQIREIDDNTFIVQSRGWG